MRVGTKSSAGVSQGGGLLIALRRDPAFIFNFGLARTAAYLAPVGLAAFASPMVYGGLETGYALCLLIVSLLACAPLFGINHQHLIGARGEVWDIAALLTLSVGVLGMTALSVASALRLSTSLQLAAAMLGLTGGQLVASFVLRMRSHTWSLAWVDGLVLMVALGLVAGPVVVGRQVEPGWLVGCFASLTAVLCAMAAAVLIRLKRPKLLSRLAQASRRGGPMAAQALLGAWAAVSGRVLVGLASPDDLPAYAVAFRVAALTVGVHQLAVTAFWARLYTDRTRRADRLLAGLMTLALALGAVLALGGPLALQLAGLDALDQEAQRDAARVLPILSVQVFFWTGHALLQNRIAASRMAGPALPWLTIASGVGLAMAGCGIALGAPLETLCWLLALGTAIYFAASCLLMRLRGLPHRLTERVGLVGGGTLAILGVVLGLFGA